MTQCRCETNVIELGKREPDGKDAADNPKPPFELKLRRAQGERTMPEIKIACNFGKDIRPFVTFLTFNSTRRVARCACPCTIPRGKTSLQKITARRRLPVDHLARDKYARHLV